MSLMRLLTIFALVLAFILVLVVFVGVIGGIVYLLLRRKKETEVEATDEAIEESFTSELDYFDLSGTESIVSDDLPLNSSGESEDAQENEAWSGISGDFSGNERIGSYDIAMQQESTLSLSEKEYIFVDDGSNQEDNHQEMPLFADDEIIGEYHKKRKQPIFYDDEVRTTGLVNLEEQVKLPKTFIFRLKTEERTEILKPEVSIGKSKAADYTIQGNNTVSRIHCVILFKDGQFFVVDNHSSNKTYVAGELVEPDTLMPIRNGDHLTISNEEFVFHTELKG